MFPQTIDKPFIERKDVIMRRSGILVYAYSDLVGNGLPNPKVRKDFYTCMVPKELIVANKEKHQSLTITKEHPPEFLNGENWERYAQGYTDKEVEVVTLEDGEVGLKTSLVFATNRIYDYYLNNNKEVSVGYHSKLKWVDNPEEVGYDILMTDILDVNHLAITAKGRGGSMVAILDSLVGGITMFKSGLFRFLEKKGKTQDSIVPFSKTVFDAVQEAQKLTGKELETVVSKTMDSLVTLKDSETKTNLLNTVGDIFLAMDKAVANKDEISKIVDSLFTKAEDETVKTMNDAFTEKKDAKVENKDTMNNGPDAPKKDEEKEDKKDAKEAKTQDTDGKGENTSNVSDSAKEEATKAMDSLIRAALTDMLPVAIQNALGVKPDTTNKTSTTDSVICDPSFDMADFLK